jgi:hypothetical protein
MARRHRAKVRHLYRHALKGYSTNLTAGQAARLRSDPGAAGLSKAGNAGAVLQGAGRTAPA